MKFIDENGIEHPPLPDDPMRFNGHPTPEEIRRRALEVRLHWSEKERRSRQARLPPWSTPEISVGGIARDP